MRIHDGVLTAWRNEIRGAKALAVENTTVALYGGYGPQRDRLVTGSLASDKMHVTGEYRLELPGGRPMPANTQIIGRGPDLHLITDNTWYRLNLEDTTGNR